LTSAGTNTSGIYDRIIKTENKAEEYTIADVIIHHEELKRKSDEHDRRQGRYYPSR